MLFREEVLASARHPRPSMPGMPPATDVPSGETGEGASTFDEILVPNEAFVCSRPMSRAQRFERRFLRVLPHAPSLNELLGHAARSEGLSLGVRNRA